NLSLACLATAFNVSCGSAGIMCVGRGAASCCGDIKALPWARWPTGACGNIKEPARWAEGISRPSRASKVGRKRFMRAVMADLLLAGENGVRGHQFEHEGCWLTRALYPC